MPTAGFDETGFIGMAVFSVVYVAVGLGVPIAASRQRQGALAAVVLVTITLLAEEVLLNSTYVIYGIALALSAMIAFPLLSAVVSSKGFLKELLEISGLIFASRVAYLPFPQKYLSGSGTLPSIYLLTFIICIMYVLVRKIDLKEMGLTLGAPPLHHQIFLGVSLGLLSGAIEYLLLRPPPLTFRGDAFQSMLYVVLVMVIFVGATEEILFRGLLLRSIGAVLPSWIALQAASIQFGLMHLGWQNPLEIIFAYIMGLVFGFVFLRFGSLFASILIHGTGNVVMFQLASLGDIQLSMMNYLLAVSVSLTVLSLFHSRTYLFGDLETMVVVTTAEAKVKDLET